MMLDNLGIPFRHGPKRMVDDFEHFFYFSPHRAMWGEFISLLHMIPLNSRGKSAFRRIHMVWGSEETTTRPAKAESRWREM
ncbi:MAG: hypothetical protein ACOZEN_16080 [Thermodesulfobacteriota bacterium]